MNPTESFTTPADGPDAILLRLVRRLRLPFSRSFVIGRVARHPQPSSLLALVEVGAELGLKVTAGRTDGPGLNEVGVPAILHFVEIGGAGGFGILEETSSDGFLVWDSRGGRRRVERDELLARWSGIVALVARDDARRVTEPNYRWNRLVDLWVGSGVPPPITGGPTAPVLSAALVLLFGSLLVMAGAGHTSTTRAVALAMMALTVVGLVVSARLTAASRDPRAALPGCPRGKLVDCESVLASRYSRITGIPLSEIGTAFFGSILLLMATSAVSPGRPEPWVMAGVAYLVGVPFALLLVVAQVSMRRFCTLCLLVHAVIASCAALAVVFLRVEWFLADALPFGILLTGYLGAILFVVVPSFTRSRGIRALVESQRRIASSPFATLAHVLAESPTSIRGAACGVRLGGAGSPHELVLFVHPSCAACARMIQEGGELAAAGKAEVFLAIAPRDHRGSDRRACEVLIAIGLGLGPDVLVDAWPVVRERFPEMLSEDPLGFLAENLSVAPDRIGKQLAAARSRVRLAEELVDAHVEGTPAVFFDGRLYPYTAPLGHLAMLLDRHPHLLEPTRSAAKSGAAEQQAAREAATT